MANSIKHGRFPLARFWLERADEARVEADRLPEGMAKTARLRLVDQYEHRARIAVQTGTLAPDE